MTKKDFEYQIVEFYDTIKGKEDGWGVTATKIKWGEDTPTVNIRNTNLTKGIVGKGVALTDLETDRLVDVLLDAGYGTVDAIEKALEERRNKFDYSDEIIQEMITNN